MRRFIGFISIIFLGANPLWADRGDSGGCFIATYALEDWRESAEFWGRFVDDESSLRSAQRMLQDLGRSEGEIRMWNDSVIADFSKHIKSTHPTRLPSINQKQAQELYDWVSDHPVAALCRLRKYDPDRTKGFCFGRATAIHFEALRRGVQKDKIYKIWAVGDYANGDGWHVATVIQAKDGSFWAIDPIMGRPLKVAEWRQQVEKLGNRVRLFISNPNRVSAGTLTHQATTYTDLKDTSDPRWGQYFRDLFEQFRREAPWAQQRRWDQPRVRPSGGN